MTATAFDRCVELSTMGLKWLAGLEGGYRLKAYRDSGGVWTISAGVTMIAGHRVKASDYLPDVHAARGLFWRTLAPFEKYVDSVTRDDISQNKFDALVSLCYNIGQRGFTGSTVLRLVNAGESSPDAIKAAFGMWHFDNGQSVRGLVLRRRAEAGCYLGLGYKLQNDMADAV